MGLEQSAEPSIKDVEEGKEKQPEEVNIAIRLLSIPPAAFMTSDKRSSKTIGRATTKQDGGSSYTSLITYYWCPWSVPKEGNKGKD